MKPLLLTFDVEEFDLPSLLGRPLSPRQQIQVTDEGVGLLLPLLAERAVRATFFVTARFARARPQTVRRLAAAGHEIAVHGLRHADDYGCMEPGRAGRRLERARQIVEEVAGAPAAGVRMPRLRPCPPAVICGAGFEYDATPHPTWVPGRYSGLHWPRAPWREDGVVRVPISVLPGIRLPVSWIWYRVAGARLGGAAARLAAARAPFLHLYFHPWEALPIARFGVPRLLAVRSGPAFLGSLDGLLRTAADRFQPMPVGEYVTGIADTWERRPPSRLTGSESFPEGPTARS